MMTENTNGKGLPVMTVSTAAAAIILMLLSLHLTFIHSHPLAESSSQTGSSTPVTTTASASSRHTCEQYEVCAWYSRKQNRMNPSCDCPQNEQCVFGPDESTGYGNIHYCRQAESQAATTQTPGRPTAEQQLRKLLALLRETRPEFYNADIFD